MYKSSLMGAMLAIVFRSDTDRRQLCTTAESAQKYGILTAISGGSLFVMWSKQDVKGSTCFAGRGMLAKNIFAGFLADAENYVSLNNIRR